MSDPSHRIVRDYLEQLTYILFLKMSVERAALTGEGQGILVVDLNARVR